MRRITNTDQCMIDEQTIDGFNISQISHTTHSTRYFMRIVYVMDEYVNLQ